MPMLLDSDEEMPDVGDLPGTVPAAAEDQEMAAASQEAGAEPGHVPVHPALASVAEVCPAAPADWHCHASICPAWQSCMLMSHIV